MGILSAIDNFLLGDLPRRKPDPQRTAKLEYERASRHRDAFLEDGYRPDYQAAIKHQEWAAIVSREERESRIPTQSKSN